VLEGQRRSFEERRVTGASATVIASNDHRVLVEQQWVDPTGSAECPEHLWQLLTVRGGSIVAMQDFGNRSVALEAMQ